MTHPERLGPQRPARVFLNLGLAVVSLLLFVGALEIAVSLRFLIRSGTASRAPLVRAREHHLPSTPPDLSPTPRWEGELQLHPLFGYVYATNSHRADNYGFLTPHAFDLNEEGYALRGRAPQQTIVIGVFGGSFAQQFVLAVQERLAAVIGSAYPTREPVVVNFALEGHAIPQTAFAFLYFRSMVDVAVFLDGYNEIWNYVSNNRAGCPPEYAKAAHYRFKTSLEELTPARFARTARLLKLRECSSAVTRWSLQTPLRGSVLVHMIWTRLVRRLDHAANAEGALIEQGYQDSAPFMEATDSEMVRIAAHQWSAYHRMIHTIAASEGILDLHALQPNIYVPDSKKLLTAGERRILEADRESSRGQCVAAGYPLLQRELASLQGQGALVADLTGVFSECGEERWIDVCHANTAGYHTVADRILSALERGSSFGPPPQGMGTPDADS